MSLFPFATSPDAAPSAILSVAAAERRRQARQLIMIASESVCHPEAAAVLKDEFGHIYAEGLPQPILCHDPRDSALDADRFESWQTRLADRRFYKGTVGANRIELLANKFVAEAFAALEGSPTACEIFVNVQALSGAAANLAVYDALIEPGDSMMGLNLSHGGHLTHGSEFNFSGKTYRVHPYGIDAATRQLDYDRIRAIAVETQPRIIVAGASSYPWDFDWAALRSIADEVGALLHADISHLAGLIVGGVLSNPVPYADVCVFTTHKTLCGPRGAVILSRDFEIAHKIDSAVFPGMQGGPHVNSMAGIARLFELILQDREGFCALQRRIVEDTAFFGDCLKEQGFDLEYGGTNTHMILVDLKSFPVTGDVPLDGEIASRLLEIGGIVCNKNVLPGDPDGAHASGLRFGLPWLTQRGIMRDQLREIAELIKSILAPVQTVTIRSQLGDDRCRGRLPQGVLENAAKKTLAIAGSLQYPVDVCLQEPHEIMPQIDGRTLYMLSGDKADLALEQMTTARLPLDGSPVCVRMLRNDGSEIDDILVQRFAPRGRIQRWFVMPHEGKADEVAGWIRGLSDGYLLFDSDDLQRKIDGPNVLEEMDVSDLTPDQTEALSGATELLPDDWAKPYFIGQSALYGGAGLAPKEAYQYAAQELPLRRTVLNDAHRALGGKMMPFAGWDMPVEYASGPLAEHKAVRSAAGLFDVSHMSVFEISGRKSLAFMDAITQNCVTRLDPGQAQYSSLLYPDGTAVDDIYVYRMEWERFLIVSNAGNAERVWDWLQAVNSRAIVIDADMPAKELDGPVTLRNLRDAGADSRVGVAFQGPLSLKVLQKLAASDGDRNTLARMVANTHAAVTLNDLNILVARTGYTGERMGFELYVHPDEAAALWNAILEAGAPMGVLPAGLAARDSTRLQAGFPLFGHELEGDLAISITEAGYGFVPRFHVPFFIGRKAYMERAKKSPRHLIRLRGAGRKSLRAGHVILGSDGAPVGQVTSFAYIDDARTFILLACVDESFNPQPGQPVTGARLTPDKLTTPVPDRALVELVALTRFPDDAERADWAVLYGEN
jgi:glycine hydroxymethyltransferase